MVPDSTFSVSSLEADVRAQARPSLQHLWQVPSFLLGCSLLLVVWATRPLWYDADAWIVRKNLSEARLRLQERRGSLNDVPGLVTAAIARIDRFPERAGEAQFLIGSAYLLLAQK